MTTEDLENPENEMKFFGQGISFANETKAIEMYDNILQDKLASYATTYETDVAILESKESVSPRLVAATRYRHSKKRILKKHLEILGALKPLASLLFAQERTGLDPKDAKSLRVTSLRKYVDSLMDLASRGTEGTLMKQRVNSTMYNSKVPTKLVVGRHVVSKSSGVDNAPAPVVNSTSTPLEDMLDRASIDENLLQNLEEDEDKKAVELLEKLNLLGSD